jgi:prepilin-type processing-associated H-X9-DG protein
VNNLKQIGLALHNYESAQGSFPLGAVNVPTGPLANNWTTSVNILNWRVLVLPYMEQSPVYSAINFNVAFRGDDAYDGGQGYTAWSTTFTTWLCPSDPDNGNGRRASYLVDPNNGQYLTGPPPIDPSTGVYATFVPVVNYSGSFGDNFTIGALTPGPNPWETPYCTTPPLGQPQIGWPGFWGTTYNCDITSATGGSLRGIFDYRTTQITTIGSITDGTSNTILAGEVLPQQAYANSFFMLNGNIAMGTTVPLGWDTSGTPLTLPGCLPIGGAVGLPWNCRFSYSHKGFKSKHPGGANILFCDGSVHFLKNTISRITWAALGSRNGGEVISSGSY